MKPHKTLIFLLVVSSLLLLIALLFPKDGIKLSQNFTLHYPTLEEIFEGGPKTNKEVDSLLIDQLALLDEGLSDTVNVQFADSVQSLLDIPVQKKVFHVDTLKTKIQKIEFANNDKSLLHKFFRKARNPKGVVRVLHYGDSQIEGDRISSFLRNRLQKKFGGYGVGLIAPKPLVPAFSIKQEYSDNWMRFPIFGAKDGKVNHNRYGVIGVFCRYTPSVKDTNKVDTLVKEINIAEVLPEASITFTQSRSAFIKDRQFRNFSVFYANGSENVLTEMHADGQLMFAKYLNTNTSLSKLHYRFSDMPETFTVKFTGKDSPDFFAIALDADKGLVVDNIPMRGSSGTYFNKMDLNLLKDFYNQLNIGMILLEFGGNVIPFIETEQGVKNYESWFYSQIRSLRKIVPNVPIIVLGVADMSKKEKEHMVSYPYIEPVRDAMKRAAHKAGAAYWDMYEAMGGKNSMPEWVSSKPKLATDDYTHYTPRGAKLIGNMFYNALMYEYQLYDSQ